MKHIFQELPNSKKESMMMNLRKLIIPGKGTNLKFFLWVWSFVALIIVLAYESLALDMTILPVLEKPANNYEDFAAMNITLITNFYRTQWLYGLGPDFLMSSKLDRYERKQGYEALAIDRYEKLPNYILGLVHKRGTHAAVFIGKEIILKGEKRLSLPQISLKLLIVFVSA